MQQEATFDHEVQHSPPAMRTCRDSLLRARIARARETRDEVHAREYERQLDFTCAAALPG